MAKSLFALNNLIAQDLVQYHRNADSVVYTATPGNVLFLDFVEFLDNLESIVTRNGEIQINSKTDGVGYTSKFAETVNVRALPYDEFKTANYKLAYDHDALDADDLEYIETNSICNV